MRWQAGEASKDGLTSIRKLLTKKTGRTEFIRQEMRKGEGNWLGITARGALSLFLQAFGFSWMRGGSNSAAADLRADLTNKMTNLALLGALIATFGGAAPWAVCNGALALRVLRCSLVGVHVAGVARWGACGSYAPGACTRN